MKVQTENRQFQAIFQGFSQIFKVRDKSDSMSQMNTHTHPLMMNPPRMVLISGIPLPQAYGANTRTRVAANPENIRAIQMNKINRMREAPKPELVPAETRIFCLFLIY